MAAKWWEPPRDALDTMVLGAADLDALKGLRHVEFTPFDPTLKARSGSEHLSCWCGPGYAVRIEPHEIIPFISALKARPA